jgi:hypothetical protein
VVTADAKPSAVDGTTINYSALSWAVRSQRQEARNQTRKALVSATPVIKMGVLLGRSPAGTQVLATLALFWAFLCTDLLLLCWSAISQLAELWWRGSPAVWGPVKGHTERKRERERERAVRRSG